MEYRYIFFRSASGFLVALLTFLVSVFVASLVAGWWEGSVLQAVGSGFLVAAAGLWIAMVVDRKGVE